MGRILTFKTNFGHAGPEMWSVAKGAHTWFFRKSLSSLGALGDLGIHKADLIRWLLGEEIDEIAAVLATRDKRNELGEWIDVEDNALCLLKTSSGIVGNLNASWTNYGDEDNSTILYCENGIVRICDDPTYPLVLEWKQGEREYIQSTQISTNQTQLKSGIIDAFIASIRLETKPEISGEEGYEALNIILACLESFETHAFVKLNHYAG